MQEKVLCSYF